MKDVTSVVCSSTLRNTASYVPGSFSTLMSSIMHNVALIVGTMCRPFSTMGIDSEMKKKAAQIHE